MDLGSRGVFLQGFLGRGLPSRSDAQNRGLPSRAGMCLSSWGVFLQGFLGRGLPSRPGAQVPGLPSRPIQVFSWKALKETPPPRNPQDRGDRGGAGGERGGSGGERGGAKGTGREPGGPAGAQTDRQTDNTDRLRQTTQTDRDRQHRQTGIRVDEPAGLALRTEACLAGLEWIWAPGAYFCKGF